MMFFKNKNRDSSRRAGMMFASLMSCLVSVHAAEYYVAVDGDDTKPGTLVAPFRTIQHGFDVAGAGDSIILRGGTYRETVVLEGKSGREHAPIMLTAYRGEKAVISGLDICDLAWTSVGMRGIFSAPYEGKTFEQLFVDGRPMLEARWPNVPRDEEGVWDFFSEEMWAKVDPDGNNLGIIKDADLAATGWDVTGASILLNVAHQFYCWGRVVEKHEAGSDTLTYPKNLGASARHVDETGAAQMYNNDLYYLIGKPEFLDAPGEWYHDVRHKRLYLIPPAGTDLVDARLEIKRRSWGLSADAESDWITVNGITFFGTAFRFGTDYTNRSSHIRIANNTVLHSSWSEYFRMPEDSPHAHAAEMYPTLNVDRSEVVNNVFAYGALGGLYVHGWDNRIENNLFHDFNYNSSLDTPMLRVGKGWPSYAGTSGRAVVRFNTLYDGGGVLLETGHGGNDVGMNYLHGAFRSCWGGNKDQAALYTGRFDVVGTRYHHNWILDGYAGTPPLPWGGGIGIRGDDNTCGLTVDHNVVWDVGSAGILIKSADNPTPEQANVCSNNTVFNHSGYNAIKSAIIIPSAIKDQNIQSTVINNLAFPIYGQWNGKPLGELKQYGNNASSAVTKADFVNSDWFDFRPVERKGMGAYECGGNSYWIPGRREARAMFPIIPDGAQNVPVNRDVLMWRPAYNAAAHVLWFGTSRDTMEKAFNGEGNVFKLPVLGNNTTYYWRVDTVMPDGFVSEGDVWSFTTETPPSETAVPDTDGEEAVGCIPSVP